MIFNSHWILKCKNLDSLDLFLGTLNFYSDLRIFSTTTLLNSQNFLFKLEGCKMGNK